MGSFESWASVVGGVLEAAGVEGFLENREARVADLSEEDGDGTAEFLRAWRELDLEPVTSAATAT